MAASHSWVNISPRNVDLTHNVPILGISSAFWILGAFRSSLHVNSPIQKLLLNQDRSVRSPEACQVLLCQAQLPQRGTFPCAKHHPSHISYILAF